MLEPYTDIAMAVSESTARFVIDARLVRPSRVRIVYLGAPLDEFLQRRPPDEIAAIRRELGASPQDVVVGTLTRLHDSKGNEYLVDAARRVLDARPQAKFYLFGEGPLRPELEAQARALKLGDRFVFAGFVKDVARVLAAFDLSVFPSLWEGTPLTLFEAMAAGKAIVATSVDGCREVLEHGRTGLLVPPRDAGALAAALVRVLGEPGLRAALSAAAREASARYDIGACVGQMEALYDEVLAERRARA
jgi:glycosyltransferase involved in cell wall biosynthesis